MVKFTVNKSENGQNIDQVLFTRYPDLSRNLFFKLLRKKDIRINGVKIGQISVVFSGDEVIAYFNEVKHFTVKYEDDNTLIVSKVQGIEVQTGSDSSPALINEIRSAYGNQMLLCHRLDRNTGGLVVIAKNTESEAKWTEAFKESKVRKTYKCLVKGKMPQPTATIKAYHFKDSKKSICYIYDEPRKNTQQIITRYHVEDYDKEKDVSTLTVELITGRTHQIRAHLAHIGHPVLGDGKYGNPKNSMGLRYQALWSYEIEFGNIKVKDEPVFK